MAAGGRCSLVWPPRGTFTSVLLPFGYGFYGGGRVRSWAMDEDYWQAMRDPPSENLDKLSRQQLKEKLDYLRNHGGLASWNETSQAAIARHSRRLQALESAIAEND